MEDRDEKYNVHVVISEDLHARLRTKMLRPRLTWPELLTDLMEKWLNDGAPTPAKEKPDPLDKEALAIREWLRQADTQPKGSVFRIQAEMIRKLVKIAMPEPVNEPIAAAPVTPAPDKERKHRRIGSNPTEEPA